MGLRRFPDDVGKEKITEEKGGRHLEHITLDKIIKSGGTIKYFFSVSEGLSRYFSSDVLEITYGLNIEEVPDSVLAVPFVSSVIPLVWITDSALKLNTLDADFVSCLDEVKKGYATMFPETSFCGVLELGTAEKVSSPCPDAYGAVFFSGGLDAVNTLVKHIDDAPELLSIWGSDISADNERGWNELEGRLSYYKDTFSLPFNVVRSAFRSFDNEPNLNSDFSPRLQDSWWHGIKHGIALIGHAAPLSYLKGWKNVYIASSNCPSDGLVRCASSPLIDDHIRFCGCRVVHDSYEDNRQDKAHNAVKYSLRSGKRLPLHVCWETESGDNCCQCEKCYRTMTSFLAEGASPSDFGLVRWEETLPNMRNELINQRRLSFWMYSTQWSHIVERICENRSMLKKKPYWKHIKWLVGKNMGKEAALEPSRAFKLRLRLAYSPIGEPVRRLKRFFVRK